MHPRTTFERLLDSTLKGPDARPSARAPHLDISPELDVIGVRATRFDREARYPSTLELSCASRSGWVSAT